jgi:hypothetical protein
MKKRHREPNGRLSRSEGEREFPPTLVRRALDDAKRKYSDRRWGTELGRLFMGGDITPAQFAAGERWGELMGEYVDATGAPIPNVRSAKLQMGSCGHEPDPDSEAGKIIAAAEARVIKRAHKAYAVLMAAGISSEAAVRMVCEQDLNVGWWVQPRLVYGLQRLAEHWNMLEGQRR